MPGTPLPSFVSPILGAMNMGTVAFNVGSTPAAGHLIEFACEFDVPVRFDHDELNVQAIIEDEDDSAEGLEGISAITIVELRE